MSDPMTRDEILSRLDAAESRTETRFVSLHADIRALTTAVGDLAKNVQTSGQEARADNTFTRWTIAGIVLTSALAVVGIVVATQGTMTAANGNVLSGIQAGLALQSAADEAKTAATNASGPPPPVAVQQQAPKR
ncbi:MAG: hypothetical protein K2X25_07735 [Caulobacteraceae bacterium]|nr:hypothetical protein [Caulobacteraceae bacterium]